MTTFDERERGFETRFAQERERLFKAGARRDRAVGLWAAGLLGKDAAEALSYADAIVDLGTGTGAEEVLERVASDLRATAQPPSEAEVGARMERELARALDASRA